MKARSGTGWCRTAQFYYSSCEAKVQNVLEADAPDSTSCPTWLSLTNGTYRCGNDIDGAAHCNNSTKVAILDCYCMT